ncbi:restriction endonuclease subunit S [Streptococcus pluranimalium]|uniref:restriction endonuclease subunit S n=1 Tax=Streptococcus pluranimalium TaxID=82348 RepID=UPI0039FBD18E
MNEAAVSSFSTLKEMSTIFKGRAIPSQVQGDSIGIINIININKGIIDYERLKTYDDKDRIVAKYYLKEGDVLIASKGTQLKIAVFEEQDRPVVASSNFTIVRPSSKVMGHYIKLFLETQQGQDLLKATDRGKAVMNLSTREIGHIPIPHLPLVKQEYAIGRYLRGQADYQRKMERAHSEWQRIQDEVKRSLF